MAEDLVLSEKLSDVTLKVRHGGYSWRFPGHSLLLNARSALIREMLEERESDAHSSPVTIVGMDPDTALAVIRYIYSGKYPTKITANLLVTAEKYGLHALRDHLEEAFIPNLTIPQACSMLDQLEHEQPLKDDCVLKTASLDLIEKHAYRVFASDLVLSFSRKTLQKLLESDNLNAPDEAIIFWGVWRWALYHSSRNSRSLDEENVTSYVEDLISLMRICSLRNKEGIPTLALQKFNRCAGRRSRFEPPNDSLEQSSSLRLCGSWEEIIDSPAGGEQGNLCLQVSFDRDVMVVGLTLEICCSDKIKGHLRVFLESSGKELLRQEINCGRGVVRKLSRTGEPETWIESDMVLSEPLVLPRSEICSIYLQISGTPWALPRTSTRTRRRKVDSTFAQLHGQDVVAVRELHVVPDMTVTWGVRR